MKRVYGVPWRWLGRKLRAQFLMGLIVSIPIIVTVWILYLVFSAVDSFLNPLIEPIMGHTIPGLGFGIMIVLIYLIGVVADNFIGKKLIQYAESLLSRLPLVRQLYAGIKQIIESFSKPSKAGYMEVVLVEFPRVGMRAIGFVTNETSDSSGKKLLHIFVPTSPNPTSGFLQIVEEDKVTRTKMSVDDALKVVISAGRVLPSKSGYQTNIQQNDIS